MAKHPKYVIKKDKAGEFRFNLTAKNGQVILKSEGYTTKSSCKNGIESVRKNSPEDARYERKQTSAGFSFNLRSANHQVIGTSEVYTTEAARNKGIDSVKANGPGAEVEDTTG